MPLSYSFVRDKVHQQTYIICTTTPVKYAAGATSALGSTNWATVYSQSYALQYPLYGTRTTVDQYSQVSIGQTSALGSTNWAQSYDLTLTLTTKTQNGVSHINATPTLSSFTSVPGRIRVGRMVAGTAYNLETPNSTAVIQNVGGFLNQFGLGFFTLGSGSRTYTSFLGTPYKPKVGSVLGVDGPGGFELGTYSILGPKYQLGRARIGHAGVQHTQTGVSHVEPYAPPQRNQYGTMRCRRVGVHRTQYGRMNVASQGSITSEVIVQTVSEVPPPTTGMGTATIVYPAASGCIGGSTPFHVVQSAQSVRNATSLAYPSNVTSGNLLIAVLGVAGSAMSNPPTVTDTRSNTWTQAVYNLVSGECLSVLYCVANSSGANTVSVTGSGFGTNSSQLIVAELSGNINPTLDMVVTGFGGSSAITTTLDVVFTAVMGYSGYTPYVSNQEILIQAVPAVGFDYEIGLSYSQFCSGSFTSTLNAGNYWDGVYVNYVSISFQQGYKYVAIDNHTIGGNERSSIGNYRRQKNTALIGQTTYRQLQVARSPSYSLPTGLPMENLLFSENIGLATTSRTEDSNVLANMVPIMYQNGPDGAGNAATASGWYYSTPPWYAFTRNTYGNWGWINYGLPNWIQFQFPTQRVVTLYRITPWSQAPFPSRSPTAWTLSGSNDGISWTTLDTQSGFTTWSVGVSEPFPISNTTAYYYYQLNLIANGGDSYVGITDLSLCGAVSLINSTSYGSYRRHKNTILNDIIGMCDHVQTAEYTIASGATLPIIGNSYALGQALDQLFNIPSVHANKLLAVDTNSYTKFNVFPSTYNAWPLMSSFTGTLTGETSTETYYSTSLMVYDAHSLHGVQLLPGGAVPGGFEGDGETNVAFNPSQVASASWHADGTTAFSLLPNAAVPNGWECDGQTLCSFSGQRYGLGPWEGDGSTSVEILSIGNLDYGWEADGSTSVGFTGYRQVNGFLEMDGSTLAEIVNTNIKYSTGWEMDGHTQVSIAPSEKYTYGNIFNLDGATNVAIGSNKAYGFGNLVEGQGVGTFQITAQKSAVIGFAPDGKTAFQIGAIADYFINIQDNGATNVAFNASYRPVVQYVFTGVGNCYFNALVGHFASIAMNGQTNVGFTGILKAEGFLQWYTGIGTSVHFGSQKSTAAHFECDGATTCSFNPNQDQLGEIAWGPFDQELTIIGSFVYDDGAMHLTTTSSIVANSTQIILGPDYISGIIITKKDTGPPDFVPIRSE